MEHNKGRPQGSRRCWPGNQGTVFLLLLCLCAAVSGSMLGNSPTPSVGDSPSSPCSLSQTSDGLSADCESLNLGSIPRDLPDDVTHLDLRKNNITTLDGSARKLIHLKQLFLDQNNMVQIHSGAFDGLAHLLEVTFSNNVLSSLPDDFFRENVNLELINLSRNKFVTVPANAFRTATNLKKLVFKYNSIRRLNFTGVNFPNIFYLDLSFNEIDFVNPDDFLPLTNSSIEIFNIDGNQLAYLPEYCFRHLTFVKNLTLRRNKIANFSISPFLGMTSLIMLDMQYNLINNIVPLNAANTSGPMLPSLTKLVLWGHKLSVIPSGAFIGLTCLTELLLSSGRIASFQVDSFAGLMSLELLDLQKNRITAVQKELFEPLTSLQTLKLSRNRFKFLSPGQFVLPETIRILELSSNEITNVASQEWQLPSLKVLDISRNRLFRLEAGIFLGLRNLTELKLSFNPVSVLSANTFSGLFSLQTLIMESLASVGGYPLQNLTKLTTLDLSGSSLSPTVWFLLMLGNLKRLMIQKTSLEAHMLWNDFRNESVFSSLSSLEYLLMSGNYLNGMAPGTFQNLTSLKRLLLEKSTISVIHPALFRNLRSLSYLYLRHNNIKVLSSQHFQGLTSLHTVHLDDNAIKDVDRHLFEHCPRLSYVYMSQNALTNIKEGTILPKVLFDISKNPLSCVCDLRWFVPYLSHSNMSLVNVNDTLCYSTSISGFVGCRLVDFQPSSSDCGPDVFLLSFVPILGILLVVSAVVSYRHRWWLNYKCFHLKLVVLGYNEFEEDREHLDYQYDVHVIYHIDNEDWVVDVFRPDFEDALPDIGRVAYGDDNLPLHMYYMDAVIDVIENSFKVVFVVSNAAIHDHIFITRFHMAVDHMNEVGFEKIVLIFVEEIPDNEMPYLIRLFLSKNKPYFLWNEDVYWQRLFWAKFAKMIKTNKQINDTLPI